MCDATMPSAYRERRVTARLVHTCYSCGFPIVRGEVYEHASGIWDGEPNDYKRHLLCSVLDRAAGHCGCWEFGGLQDARDRDDMSWVFRRAWETVTGIAWAECADCAEPLPFGSNATVCDGCLSFPPSVASW